LPERLATEPGSATFIREQQSPAADAVLPAADHRPTDAAGADDDNAAVLSRMGADTGGLRVADDQGMAERQASRARGGQFSRLGGAGEREAGIGPCQSLLVEPGFGEALPGGIDHRCKGRVQPKAEIGRSGGPLSKDIPGAIGEPRAPLWNKPRWRLRSGCAPVGGLSMQGPAPRAGSPSRTARN